jgi:hypothetical protein
LKFIESIAHTVAQLEERRCIKTVKIRKKRGEILTWL